MLQTHRKSWNLELPWASWTYHISIKQATWFPPFHSVYGTESLLTLEVEILALNMSMKID